MPKYYELYIKINPQIEDDISNICFENLDCEGVLLEEQKFKELEMTETTRGTLKVFLRSDKTIDGKSVLEFMKNKRQELLELGFSSDDLGSWDCNLLEKENEDWSKKWKENWDVTHITDKVVVVPSWLDYSPKPDEIVISLDPGCAFGTGTHQTTKLCVVGMEQHLDKIISKEVADIGMGSGILSIIAKKFGADYVYGCDNDETVIEVAKENAAKNGCDCHFEYGTIDKVDKKFDFICANILHNVLSEIMPDLKRLLKKDGIVVLSGILNTKQDIVKEAIENNNMKIFNTNVMDVWVSFVVSA